ncbi:MAG: inseCt neurotoxin 1c [Clostridiaceae bacterium]|nr:inseCt neurotoxin 1c [Clostridiaceae bacterium]
MSELLFFILGLIIGGLEMTTLMCCLQVNRVNELEREIVLRPNTNEDDSEVVECEVEE